MGGWWCWKWLKCSALVQSFGFGLGPNWTIWVGTCPTTRGIISHIQPPEKPTKKLWQPQKERWSQVHLMPRERFNTISQGLFYSKLIYCLQVIGNVWGLSANDKTNRRYTAFTKEDNRKLQTLQNQVLRLKTGLSRYTPNPTLLSASGDLSVQQLTAFYTLTAISENYSCREAEICIRKIETK